VRLAALVFLMACNDEPGCSGDATLPRSGLPDAVRPSRSAARTPAAEAAAKGAPSPAALVASAQRAIAEDDFETLVSCLWPETRDAWLADLLVELAVESTDAGHEPDREKRARQAEVRRILGEYGATLQKKPPGLTQGTLGKHLVESASDRVGLYAALLRFAKLARADFDPACAITGADEASSSSVPLLRLTARLAPPAALEPPPDGGVVEPPPAEGPFAVFLVGSGGPAVLRMRAAGGAYWLDES